MARHGLVGRRGQEYHRRFRRAPRDCPRLPPLSRRGEQQENRERMQRHRQQDADNEGAVRSPGCPRDRSSILTELKHGYRIQECKKPLSSIERKSAIS